MIYVFQGVHLHIMHRPAVGSPTQPCGCMCHHHIHTNNQPQPVLKKMPATWLAGNHGNRQEIAEHIRHLRQEIARIRFEV